MFGQRSSIVVLTCMGLLTGACSSDSIKDMVGLSKAAPDERTVRVHDMLALPPDYDLRPPKEGGPLTTTDAVTPQTGQPAPYVPPQQPGATRPRQVANADPNAPTSISPSAVRQPQPVAQQPQPVARQPRPASTSGISTTHPDGRPKSEREIVDELRKKRIDEKKRANPKYGTIWNVWDSVWGD